MLTRMEKILALHIVEGHKRNCPEYWGKYFSYREVIDNARKQLNHENPNYRRISGNLIIRQACKMHISI